MGQATKPTRQNRTITVDFQDEATYFQLLGETKAFVEFVLAFLLSLGFQLLHKASCSEGGSLTRHSHYARVRLGGLTLWRVQCTTCKAVFTVLPHCVLRSRQMRPEVARDAGDAWGAEFGAVRGPLSRLAHGALPLDLRSGAAESGASAHAMWATAACLCPGG